MSKYLIILVIFLVFLNGCSNRKSSYEKYVDAINAVDADVYLYGKDIVFDYELEYTMINDFFECLLESESNYNYLIISANSDFVLSEDDIERLKFFIQDDYKVIYVGLPYIFPYVETDKESFGFSRNQYDNINMYFYDSEKSLALNSSQNDEYNIIYFIVSDLKYYNE